MFLLLSIVLVALVSLVGCGENTVDTGGKYEDRSSDEIRVTLNDEVQASMHKVQLNPSPVFETGSSEGNLNIVNSKDNPYPQLIEIYLADGNTLLYQGVVDIGYQVEKAKLLVDLDAGEYDCLAYVSAVDRETGESAGNLTLAAKMRIKVKS